MLKIAVNMIREEKKDLKKIKFACRCVSGQLGKGRECAFYQFILAKLGEGKEVVAAHFAALCKGRKTRVSFVHWL